MKYKVGDRVRLKYERFENIDLRQKFAALPDRVATIERVSPSDENEDDGYLMVEIAWRWEEDEIECLVEEKVKEKEKEKEKEIIEPIRSRWEFLDLRKD